jgi:F-type H+-transporting ATPase subunit b
MNTLLLNIAADGGVIGKLVDAGSRVQETFQIQWSMLIMQIINFLVVALVLYRFAFKPLMAVVEERQKKIADGLQHAEEMKHKLEESEKKYTEILKQGTLEAQRTIDEAREHAKLLMEKHTQESISKAEDIIHNARHAAAYEHEKMLENVKNEIVQLVVSTTSKVLSKELTPEQRNAYSEAASKELYSKN